MLTLGIDSGTQSTKTIVLDTDTGDILASAQAAYGLIEGLPPGHMEQDPADWIQAVEKTASACIAKIGARRREIRGIGVSGQQHGLVVLDRQNNPIRPAKLWCDTSTVEQCEQFAAEFGGREGLIRLAGNPILPGYTAPKLLWMKQNEPGNFKAIECIQLPHDYINFWLTGEKRMEYGDASGTGFLDIRTREWCRPLMDFVDPEISEHLPTPSTSAEPAGLLRSSLCEKWELDAEIVVSAGGGDNMMGAIGTGNIRDGVITASLGTSGTLYSFSAVPVIDSEGEIAAFCDSTDHWLPLICTMNVTVATEQVRSLFGWSHAQLEEALVTTSPGAGGVLFLPYLNGERTPNLPNGRGVYHGLTTGNMTAANFARATMEGVTLGLAYGLKRFRDQAITPSEIRLTGGGSRSAAWRQLAADIFGAPTVTLQSAEGAALGAAVQALWAVGTVNGAGQSLAGITDRLVRVDTGTRAEPDPDRVAFYETALSRQTDLTNRLHAAGYL